MQSECMPEVIRIECMSSESPHQRRALRTVSSAKHTFLSFYRCSPTPTERQFSDPSLETPIRSGDCLSGANLPFLGTFLIQGAMSPSEAPSVVQHIAWGSPEH